MRYKGRITRWQDERGFGFIDPLAGGDRVFAHIKSFAGRRGRRPVDGETVMYELERDSKGRLQGVNIAFSGGVAVLRPLKERGAASRLFAVMFIAFVAAAVAGRRLPALVLAVYASSSIITYLVYAWDKSAARNDRRRVREDTLHVLGLLCGWPGALLAQQTLRHKSRKLSFRIVLWLTVLVNCAALAWIFMNPWIWEAIVRS